MDTAKQVLAANEAVLYGIFGVIGSSGYFPPREFLNEFLMQGSDPCDQDRRMGGWQPFAVSPDEYREIKEWWVADHAGAIEDGLGAKRWGYLTVSHGDPAARMLCRATRPLSYYAALPR